MDKPFDKIRPGYYIHFKNENSTHWVTWFQPFIGYPALKDEPEAAKFADEFRDDIVMVVYPEQLYIRHEDLQTPTNGVAYFGPFTEEEIFERINDAYADALAQSGDVEAVYLPDDEAWKCTNTKEYWDQQEKTLS